MVDLVADLARWMSYTFVTLVFTTPPKTIPRTQDGEHLESWLFTPLIIPLSVVYFCWLILALLSGSPRYVFDSVSELNSIIYMRFPWAILIFVFSGNSTSSTFTNAN